MRIVISEIQYEKIKEISFKYLDQLSENWDVEYFIFDEIRIADSKNRRIISYNTNVSVFDEKKNVITIAKELVNSIDSFFPLINEYDISEWFSKKYDRIVDVVDVDYYGDDIYN